MSQVLLPPPAARKPSVSRGQSSPAIAPAHTPAWDVDPQTARSAVSAHLQAHKDLDYQKVFLERRNALLGLITGTRGVLYDLQKRRPGPLGTVQYPLPSSVRSLAGERGAQSPRPEDRGVNGSAADTPADLHLDGQAGDDRGRDTALSQKRRSPSVGSESQRSIHGRRGVQPVDEDTLKVLKLVVKSAPSRTGSTFIDSLEEKSAANLLQEKIADTLIYLEKLHNRTQDTSSKVLVTGDLNAGKSTFVNAVLRREVVPSDQQPCTAAFCEVVDAAQNDDKEEVHAVPDAAYYDRKDPHTFTRFDLRNLRDIVAENEEGAQDDSEYELFKVYCHDKRAATESLLKNGLVDISLIDSPGLNIDSMKTMSLFAQQEEIDVIVFLVHAENQFTQSGKEFLSNAGNEKGYIFVVVNRFDMIVNKDRCRRDILEQIRRLSPRTHADADNLVHFVSARNCLRESQETGRTPDDFANLERCLRAFILEKRLTSKLAPAKVYLHNLLDDLTEIVNFNRAVVEGKFRGVVSRIEEDAPLLKRLLVVKETVIDSIDNMIDGTTQVVQAHTRETLNRFLEDIDAHAQEPKWKGLLGVINYAHEVRSHIYRLAVEKTRSCERFAKFKTDDTLARLGDKTQDCLAPPDGVTRDVNVNQVWMEGMDVLPSGNDTTLAAPKKEKTDVKLEISDFLDFRDQWDVAQGYLPSVALVGGGLLGYRTFAESMFRITGSIGVKNLVRLAGFGVALAGIAALFFAVNDMPHKLSRKIAVKVKKHLEASSWSQFQVDRLGRNVRRTLRLSIWDVKNRFDKKLDETQKTRKSLETERSDIGAARAFWEDVAGRVAVFAQTLAGVDIDS